MVTKKRAEVSRLRRAESVMSQCGKFEFDALVDREPVKMLKDGKWVPRGTTWPETTPANAVILLVWLQVLPLLTLYQFWATSVCRDIQWTIDCRITRLRALCDATLFTDAVRMLHSLMTGDRLPQPLTGDFRSTELAAEQPVFISLNTALPLVEETNMMVGHSVVWHTVSDAFLSTYSGNTCSRILID